MEAKTLIRESINNVSENRVASESKSDNVEYVGVRMKYDTLQWLSNRAKGFKILPCECVTWSDWKSEKHRELDDLWSNKELTHPLIVRSSCSVEDSSDASHAGEFQSVLNVDTIDKLSNSIDLVFASYSESAVNEQVMVQPMVFTAAFEPKIPNCAH